MLFQQHRNPDSVLVSGREAGFGLFLLLLSALILFTLYSSLEVPGF